MALAGVHIRFSNVTMTVKGGAMLPDSGSILSQTMASPGTSSIAAPSGLQLLSLCASAPIFYAVGQNPDASGGSTNRSYYDPTTGREDMFVHVGDKVAWMLA